MFVIKELEFLLSPLSILKGFGEKTVAMYKKLLTSKRILDFNKEPKILDLLYHKPDRVQYRRENPDLKTVQDGELITVDVIVDFLEKPYKKSQPYKIRCYNETGFITVVYFNTFPDFISRNFKEGNKVKISGKVERFNNELQMSHPDYINNFNIPSVEQIYPLTAGLSNKVLRQNIQNILSKTPNLPEWIDNNFLFQHQWKSWKDSLLGIHNAKRDIELSERSPYIERLAFDEILANQIALGIMREKIKSDSNKTVLKDKSSSLKEEFLKKLPFKLTNDQNKAINEIEKDIYSNKRMLRLLQGDVGSGKTVVAFMTMLPFIQNHKQIAIMVPTSILATQHYEWIKKMCESAVVEQVFFSESQTCEGHIHHTPVNKVSSLTAPMNWLFPLTYSVNMNFQLTPSVKAVSQLTLSVKDHTQLTPHVKNSSKLTYPCEGNQKFAPPVKDSFQLAPQVKDSSQLTSPVKGPSQTHPVKGPSKVAPPVKGPSQVSPPVKGGKGGSSFRYSISLHSSNTSPNECNSTSTSAIKGDNNSQANHIYKQAMSTPAQTCDINSITCNSNKTVGKPNTTSYKMVCKDNSHIPYRSDLVEKSRELRKTMTVAERKFYNFILKSESFNNIKWDRQKPIDNFILDFYSSLLKIDVEIDGPSHENKEFYDTNRDDKLIELYGIKTVRYSDDEIKNNIDGVFEDFKKVVEERFRELDNILKKELNSKIKYDSCFCFEDGGDVEKCDKSSIAVCECEDGKSVLNNNVVADNEDDKPNVKKDEMVAIVRFGSIEYEIVKDWDVLINFAKMGDCADDGVVYGTFENRTPLTPLHRGGLGRPLHRGGLGRPLHRGGRVEMAPSQEGELEGVFHRWGEFVIPFTGIGDFGGVLDRGGELWPPLTGWQVGDTIHRWASCGGSLTGEDELGRALDVEAEREKTLSREERDVDTLERRGKLCGVLDMRVNEGSFLDIGDEYGSFIHMSKSEDSTNIDGNGEGLIRSNDSLRIDSGDGLKIDISYSLRYNSEDVIFSHIDGVYAGLDGGAKAEINRNVETELDKEKGLKLGKEKKDDRHINVALLTGKVKGKKREKILKDLKDGKIDILVGTHAIFQENVEFKDLGYAVIDEQHRFGVSQRLSLIEKGDNVDILIMTATPIPRTLSLTIYGDMEVSTIKEKPKNRKEIITSSVNKKQFYDLVNRIKEKIKNGDKVYWICPLIDESENLAATPLFQRYEELKMFFNEEEIGFIHGKLTEDEKDKIMEEFGKKDGVVKILIATTVIEVGIDVPDATIIVIENPDRFGLSQMHQLRGRVGRGYKQSYCILFYEKLGENSVKRMNILKNSSDGFFIAEEDLKLRGSGEVLGVRQSGFQEYLIADLSEHYGLLLEASKMARYIVGNRELLNSYPIKVLLELFGYNDCLNGAILN